MNILTIDLEEWFHVIFEGDSSSWDKAEVRIYKNTEFILDALHSHKSKATFFTLGWIARQHPDLIKRIHNEGFEIGTHSDFHRAAHRLSKNEFKEDVKRSIDSLESITGKKIISFRAPYFSITNFISDYVETLTENGIEIDSSICPILTRHGGFEKFPVKGPCLIKFNDSVLKEFPVSTYSLLFKSILSGGGYFRLLPFTLINSLIRNQSYNMTYFHPHDFDVAQPALNLSLIDNIRRTIGSKSSGKKFKKLLSAFEYLDIEASDKLIDWNNASVVNLQ